MTATMHFVTGYHGNVGKSTFASLLEYVLSQSDGETSLFDCDEEKQTLVRLYGKDNVNVSLFSPDPDLSGAADLILEAAIAKRDKPIELVIDLAADTDRHLNDWLANRGVASAAKAGRFNIIKWWVTSDQPDSLAALLKSKEAFPHIPHVLVRNHYTTRVQFWNTVNNDESIKAAFSDGLKAIDFYRGFGNLVRSAQDKGANWQKIAADKKEEICSDIDRFSHEEWINKNRTEILSVYDVTAKTSKTKKKAEAK